LRALGRLAQLRQPEQEGGLAYDEFAADEVALTLSLSPGAAHQQLELGSTLCRRLPATLAALENGEIDLVRARALAECTQRLSDEQASAVEAKVLAGGGRASHADFRRAARRAVLRADPDGANRRQASARRDRRVELGRDDDGMASLWAFLPAEDAVAAYDRLTLLAREVGADDERCMDARRADILSDLLLGRAAYVTAPAAVNVTVPVTTLAGLDDQPGELAGYGTIPAPLARQLAEHATWRRILYDPADGTVLEVSRRRFPSPGLARYVRARNAECSFPGCGYPADLCDVDHNVPYAKGGITAQDNLGPACRRHNRLKERDGWTVTQPAPGYFVWTSPAGVSGITEPTRYGQPDLEPHPRAAPPKPGQPAPGHESTHDLGPPPF
ncbi:MAG: DUF222 domain-containing protein, partial [Frankia sp.]